MAQPKTTGLIQSKGVTKDESPGTESADVQVLCHFQRIDGLISLGL